MKLRRTKTDKIDGDVEVTDNDELRIGGELVSRAWDGRIDIEAERVELEDFGDAEKFIIGLNRLIKQVHGKSVFEIGDLEDRLAELETQLNELRDDERE